MLFQNLKKFSICVFKRTVRGEQETIAMDWWLESKKCAGFKDASAKSWLWKVKFPKCRSNGKRFIIANWPYLKQLQFFLPDFIYDSCSCYVFEQRVPMRFLACFHFVCVSVCVYMIRYRLFFQLYVFAFKFGCCLLCICVLFLLVYLRVFLILCMSFSECFMCQHVPSWYFL